MKLIVNERDGCCESVNIEYTPTEALIINHAMRRYVDDEEVNKKDRKAMEQMLEVKPVFVQEPILDKIRAQIEKDAFKDVNGSKFISVNRVNQIIDKYKAESEGKE